EHLADRYGIELQREEEDPRAAERRRQRDRLYELLERATAFYERYLWDSDEAAAAREYLAGRRLEEATLREFRVGYAPSAYDRMLRAARQAGLSNREAYTDVLAMHQGGLGNTVGLMGTALTADQVGELARLVGGSDQARVTLALDADASGQEAMLRAAAVAAGRKLDLRVAALPEGRDPADLVMD